MSIDIRRTRSLYDLVVTGPKERAESLACEIPKALLYVGVLGAKIDTDEYPLLPGVLHVRRVTNAPAIVSVCAAAQLKHTDYLGIARYSHGIQAELVSGIGAGADEELEFTLGMAWEAAALLKLRGHPLLLCPAYSSVSWDLIAGVSDNSVRFGSLDDVPKQIRPIHVPRAISAGDAEWVGRYFKNSLELRDAQRSRRFGLAFNLSYTWNHTSDVRVGLASLWCGIEALFGVQFDQAPVTKRLVQRIAAWIPSWRWREVWDLYEHRCDAVHGRNMADGEIHQAISDADCLLRECLVACIERGNVPLSDWT